MKKPKLKFSVDWKYIDFTKDPLFENIVFGYDVLLHQLIKGYEQNLEKLELLNERLSMSNNAYSD